MSRLVDSRGKIQMDNVALHHRHRLYRGYLDHELLQGHFQTTMGIQRAVGLEKGSAYGDPNSMAATLILGMPFMYYLAKPTAPG